MKELKEMLGEKEHTEQLKFKSSNLLYRVSIATLVLARVGGSPLNYSQIKHRALTLVPAILGLLDELLSLVKGLCVLWKVSLGRKVPGILVVSVADAARCWEVLVVMSFWAFSVCVQALNF